MFQRFHALRERREGGFTLIELLVVVLIIAILAAIAIPVFLNQRRKAWRSQIQSDLKNAAIALEDCSVDANGDYAGDPDDTGPMGACNAVAGGAATTLEGDGTDTDGDYGFNRSEDVTITTINADANGYCIVAQHANLTTGATEDDPWGIAAYSSNSGAPTADETICGP